MDFKLIDYLLTNHTQVKSYFLYDLAKYDWYFSEYSNSYKVLNIYNYDQNNLEVVIDKYLLENIKLYYKYENNELVCDLPTEAIGYKYWYKLYNVYLIDLSKKVTNPEILKLF